VIDLFQQNGPNRLKVTSLKGSFGGRNHGSIVDTGWLQPGVGSSLASAVQTDRCFQEGSIRKLPRVCIQGAQRRSTEPWRSPPRSSPARSSSSRRPYCGTGRSLRHTTL
jgi:hypothetical protein